MIPNNSCTNPLAVLRDQIIDGWTNTQILEYFELLGFTNREIIAATYEARRKSRQEPQGTGKPFLMLVK